MKKFILLFIFIFISFIFLIKINSNKSIFFPNYSIKNVQIGLTTYTLALADTQEKQEKGLSGISQMPSQKGMLFIYPKKGFYKFWMKNMLFPLDFIFIDNKTIIDLKENVVPSSYPSQIFGNKQYNFVIEFNAGEIKKNNIQIGQAVSF